MGNRALARAITVTGGGDSRNPWPWRRARPGQGPRGQARDRLGQGSEGRAHGSFGHILGKRDVHGWRVEVIRRLAFHGRRESRCRWPRAAAPRRPETKVLIGFSFW